jgi:hypothetical protein
MQMGADVFALFVVRISNTIGANVSSKRKSTGGWENLHSKKQLCVRGVGRAPWMRRETARLRGVGGSTEVERQSQGSITCLLCRMCSGSCSNFGLDQVSMLW